MAKEKSEIMTFPNRYKDTLDYFIDSLDLESPNWRGPMNEGSRNVPKSVSSLTRLLEEGYLNKDVADCQSTRRALETRNFYVHQHRNVASFCQMSRKKY